MNETVKKHKPSLGWLVPAIIPILGIGFILLFSIKSRALQDKIEQNLKQINKKYVERGVQFKLVRPTKRVPAKIIIQISSQALAKAQK